MLNSAPKRLILPFSSEKSREPFSSEIELASIYAFAEFGRSKGGGLVVRQPSENIQFIAQAGFPLWLYPKNDNAYIFNGLKASSYKLQYSLLPPAKVFMDSLETNSKIRQNYEAFLVGHQSYFQQPRSEKEVLLTGLIVDGDFKKEFSLYRRETVEALPANLALLSPSLEESEINTTLNTIAELQAAFRVDADSLPEILRQINRITSQYVTEIDYATQAVKDEANAKIKAREELVNPQITKLNSDYKKRIANVTKSYNDEIENFEKQKGKTEKSIANEEEKIRQFQREADSQARKNHTGYEKRWRDKVGKVKKEVDGLTKTFSKIEKSIRDLNRSKTEELSKLNAKLAAEIKVARQPILDLQAIRDSKMLVYKQEIEKLLKLEKAIAETLYGAIKEREALKDRFEALGIKDPQLRGPTLFYVPFYVVCYQAGLSRRYLFLPPSITSAVGFSAKLKGAFGMSKIKEMLVPRFKAIKGLIDNCQILIRQDTSFETEIAALGEKNNLLGKTAIQEGIGKGLVYLKHEGWLSEREYQALSSSLKNA